MKWICKICGYEHEGDSPPDECPICGAGPEEFERVEEVPSPAQQPVPAEPTGARLACALCDQDLSSLPTICPSCAGATGHLGGATGRAKLPGAARYVIAGGGVAAWSAAERIRAADPDAPIVMLSSEPCAPYYRLSLTRYLGGELQAGSVVAHPASWWAQRGIELSIETDVLRVDPARKELHTSRGTIAYDKLVAATGARAFVPPLKNASLHGITALRTLEDARLVLRLAAPGVPIAIVGGGILGLETAFGLARRGCEVTVCEGASQLLPRQLDRRAASMFQAHLEKKGIRFVLGDMPAEVAGDEAVRGLKLASGALIEARLIVVSAGVRPNTLLWQQAGLRVERGLVVDDTMRTSNPDIFAAGDLAEHKGVLYGIWPAAMEMGRVAGANAAGGAESFPGLPMSHALKVVDLEVFSIGATRADREGMSELVRPLPEPSYAKLVLDKGVLAGAILMGDTSLGARIREWIDERRDLGPLLERKLSPGELFAQLG